MKSQTANPFPCLRDFRALVEHAHIAIFLGDDIGNILFANKAASQLFGYDMEEFTSLHRNQLFNNISHAHDIFSHRSENHPVKGELTGRRKNGELFTCEVYSVLFRDGDNELRASTSIIDVSKQVHAEKQAAAFHQSLGLILNNTKESYILANKNGVIQSFNNVTAHLLKELFQINIEIGHSIFQYISADKEAQIRQIIEAVLQGQLHDMETKVKLAAGKELVLKMYFKPARKENGEIVGVIISAIDITTHKNATELLKLSEQRWRFALEGSNQGVWDWNIETGDVYFSPAWKKLFGFDEEQTFTIEDWKERIHPQDRILVESDVEKHLAAADALYENEYRFRNNNGTYRWLLSRGMLLEKAADGSAIRMIGTHSDITEKKEAEDKYRILFNNSPLPMWTYDLQTFSFNYVNSAAIAHYGYTEKDFRNMSVLNLYPVEDREQFKMESTKLGKTNQVKYEKVKHLTRNGDVIYVNITASIIEINNRKAVLALIEDVTDKLIAERELKQAKAHYELLFYNNPLPSYIYDVNSLQIVEVNHKALEHYGYSKETFLSFSAASLWHVEDVALFYKNLNQKNKFDTFSFDKVRQYKEGFEIFYANIHSNRITFNDRECRVVVINDVTDIVSAQEALKKSNDRFEYAAKASSDALWEWEIETNTVYNSPAFYDIFGYDVHSGHSHKQWELFIHPDDKEETLLSFYHAIENKEVTRWLQEYRYRKADGSYAFVSDKAIIIRNPFGKAIRVIGALQDITQQKEAQLALVKSNERYTLARRATSDAIWDWDIASDHLSWGEGVFYLFGHDERKLSMERWSQYVHPDDLNIVNDSIAAALASSNTSWSKEYRFQKRDKSYSYVLDRGFIIRDPNGQAVRMIGAMQDITLQKYQQQLTALEVDMYEFNTKKDKSLPDIISKLVDGLETLHPQLQVSVLVLNDKAKQPLIISKSLPENLVTSLQQFSLTANDNPYTKALHLLQPLIIENLSTDPDWMVFGELARKHSIYSGWFVPIIDNNEKPVGTIAFYSTKAKKPTQLEWNTITKLRNLLRILIENYFSLEQLKRSNERFDIAMKATHDLIWDLELETGKIYRAPDGLQTVFGLTNTQKQYTLKDWLRRIHPEDLWHVKRVMLAIMHTKDKRIFDAEYRFLKDDGTYSYVYDRGILLLDKEGKPYRIIGAAQNVTKRKQLELELIQKELEKQNEISQASIETQEQERAEIGKELHDNVNQVLTTTKLYLDLAQNNPDLKDNFIEKSNKNIQYIINEIRQLSRSLMNPSIGDLGLIDAVSDLVESINITKKIKVRFTTNKCLEKALTDNQKLMIYRIIQEGLNNVVKHAQAETAAISLQLATDQIELIIKDDGKGFQPTTVKKGVGLNNIQNRVYLTNGSFAIESAPNKGSILTIKLPQTKLEKNPN